MLKTEAIDLLGGSTAAAAEAIGISYQAVDKWPEELPARISDRVLAALARMRLPPETLESLTAPPAPEPEGQGAAISVGG